MNDNNQENAPKNASWVNKLVENIIVPTAVFSAIGYYLGWTASSAYYITLGLSPSFIKKSPQELWSYAWVEIVLAALLLIFAFASYQVMGKFLSQMKSRKKLLFLFFILWITSVAGIVFFGLQTTVFRSFETNIRLRSIIFLGITILGLLITAYVGKLIQEQTSQEDKNRWLRLFGFVFPNYYIYLIIVATGLIFTLSRISALRGYIAGLNDASPSSGLPSVVLYSENPLPLNGTFDSHNHLYVYQHYFLVDVTDDYIIILQNDNSVINSVGFNTFAIPKKNEIILQVTR